MWPLFYKSNPCFLPTTFVPRVHEPTLKGGGGKLNKKEEEEDPEEEKEKRKKKVVV